MYFYWPFDGNIIILLIVIFALPFVFKWACVLFLVILKLVRIIFDEIIRMVSNPMKDICQPLGDYYYERKERKRRKEAKKVNEGRKYYEDYSRFR